MTSYINGTFTASFVGGSGSGSCMRTYSFELTPDSSCRTGVYLGGQSNCATCTTMGSNNECSGCGAMTCKATLQAVKL